MKAKPFVISKHQVMQAYQLVKANAGAAGVDKQSLNDFDKNLKDNLYKLWNRMSSGSYFPPPVKAVAIPKKTGGERILGVPTVSDRIAQMVVKLQIEPGIEPHFLQDSYGYRPSKSALDAVDVTRRRCWHIGWVLEFDIKGLFDNIPHDLLLKAVRKHVQCPWALLYVERWLKAPLQLPGGSQVARNKGTPQGGVVSPLLSNLFLHYVFDVWMTRKYPSIRWCRYADDGLCHCHSLAQARYMKAVIERRFGQCGLELHPQKTKIVYCQDGKRRKYFSTTSFDFLGFTFRRRTAKTKAGELFLSFNPAISKAAMMANRSKIRKSNLRNRVDLNLKQIARWFNPIIRGWINYYGRFNRAALYPLLRSFNHALRKWVMCKYKRFRGKKTRAGRFLEEISKIQRGLFVHWRLGMTGVFA